MSTFDPKILAETIVQDFSEELLSEQNPVDRRRGLIASCETTLTRFFPDKFNPIFSEEEQRRIDKVLQLAFQVRRSTRDPNLFVPAFAAALKAAGLEGL